MASALKVYSEQSLLPKQWNKDDQRALTRGYAGNGALNDRLELLETRLQECCEQHLALGLVPAAAILKALAELEQTKKRVVANNC